MARELTTEIVYCLAANAGAFWSLKDNQFWPACLINKQVIANGPPGFDRFRRSALDRAHAERRTVAFPPISQRDHYSDPLNPSHHLMIYAPVPWLGSKNPFSILEIVQRPTSRQAVCNGYNRFISQMVAKIGSSYNVGE
jgi:hypothetical protein